MRRFACLFRFIACSSLLVVMLQASNLNAQAQGKAQRVKAIQLRQTHFFFGETELTISKFGVKMECMGHMQFIVVARAPSWTVTIYRQDDKTYFDEPMAKFVDTGPVSGIMLTYREKFVLEGSHPAPVEISGFKAIKLVDKHNEFIFIPDDHSLPPQALDFVFAGYKLPTCGGIPLRYVRMAMGKDMLTQLDETGHNLLQLKTTSLKNVVVPLSFFDPPRGLHRAKSLGDVVLSVNKRNESADFQLMFDKIDEPKKSSKKTQH